MHKSLETSWFNNWGVDVLSAVEAITDIKSTGSLGLEKKDRKRKKEEKEFRSVERLCPHCNEELKTLKTRSLYAVIKKITRLAVDDIVHSII